jgi:hypothetical protein
MMKKGNRKQKNQIQEAESNLNIQNQDIENQITLEEETTTTTSTNNVPIQSTNERSPLTSIGTPTHRIFPSTFNNNDTSITNNDSIHQYLQHKLLDGAHLPTYRRDESATFFRDFELIVPEPLRDTSIYQTIPDGVKERLMENQISTYEEIKEFLSNQFVNKNRSMKTLLNMRQRREESADEFIAKMKRIGRNTLLDVDTPAFFAIVTTRLNDELWTELADKTMNSVTEFRTEIDKAEQKVKERIKAQQFKSRFQQRRSIFHPQSTLSTHTSTTPSTSYQHPSESSTSSSSSTSSTSMPQHQTSYSSESSTRYTGHHNNNYDHNRQHGRRTRVRKLKDDLLNEEKSAIEIIMDTGANVNLLSKKAYERMNAPPLNRDDRPTILQAEGPVTIEGSTNIYVKDIGMEKFYLAPKLLFDEVIFGRDLVKKLNVDPTEDTYTDYNSYLQNVEEVRNEALYAQEGATPHDEDLNPRLKPV